MSTFADALSSFNDQELRKLIAHRPDAFFPTPPSVGALATRLGLAGSVAHALRSLNAADLYVLEQLGDLGAELDPVDATAMSPRPASSSEKMHPVQRLRERALVYGPDTRVRIAPGALSGLPVDWRVSDTAPHDVAERIQSLSPRERHVLDTLAAAGGRGTTPPRSADTKGNEASDSPIDRLLAQELIVRADATTVRLPRPVREALTGQQPRIYPLTPPTPPRDNTPAEQHVLDEAATGQGLETVRQMRQLLIVLLREPVALNKDATVGVRTLNALGKQLECDATTTTLLITVGESAGLIGRGNTRDTDVLAATRDALSWLDAGLSDQWAILLAGWAASPWRIDTGQKLLSSDMHVPDVRHARLTIVRHGGDEARLLFHAPLAAAGIRPALIQAVVHEAQQVGALVRAPDSSRLELSSPLRALLDHNDVSAATKALVPQEVDYLIAEADMTILAPGPLTPEATRFLERIAHVESPGLASMWRIDEASIRKAYDTGLTRPEIHQWLAHHVVGDVPQAMTFLIDDVARTHGSIRAGQALSYVRSDDPALLSTAAQHVSLRVLAPTVAVSDQPLHKLMAQLREAGLQPSAEDEHGAELQLTDEPTLVRATPSTLPHKTQVDDAQIDRIIAALRSPTQPGAASDAPDSAAVALELLRAAARSRRHVKLGYVDKHGRGKTLTVLPLSVTAGQVDALDEATDRVIRVALARITRVILA